MNAATRHRLEGLEPENLLAFMALLGLLRALETARPDLAPRAYWDVETLPWRPWLTLAVPLEEDEIAEAATVGVAALARAHNFDRDDLNHSGEQASAVLDAARNESPERRALLDALMSDGAVKDDGRVWPTPLCFLFGQGHQHFLARLADVPRGVLPAKLAKLKTPPNLTDPAYIAAALFAPWQREAPTDGLRWDPAEDRRYALRADDPSGDPAGQEHGANRLAAVGLPVLAGTVVERGRGELRFLNRATRYSGANQIEIVWPVWTRPARLSGIEALLSHPDVIAAKPDAGALARLGVAAVMTADRISIGKFFNVTAARQVEPRRRGTD